LAIVRYLLGALGLILLYVAFFITGEGDDNEQEKMANRLDKAWKRIREAQSVALSWQAAFCQAVAELFNSFLKSLFGDGLLSFGSLAIAVVICAVPNILFFLFEPASILFKVLLVAGLIALWDKAEDHPTLIGMAATTLLSLCPAFYRWWNQGGLSDWFYSLQGGHDFVELSAVVLKAMILPAFAATIVGVACLALFLSTNKFLLKRSTSGSPVMLLLVLGANILLTALFFAPLVVPSIVLARSVRNDPDPLLSMLQAAVRATDPDTHPFAIRAHVASIFLAVVGILPALSAVLLVLLVILMLVHRLIWPTLWRPIYAMHYHKLIEQHKLLGALGALCLWKAFPNSVTEFLHSTLLKFP
jgi:hypothetical protein